MAERSKLRQPVLADEVAARWALRCADGLAAAEKEELAAWLAANPRHAALLAEHRRAWDRFAPLSSRPLTSRPAWPVRFGWAALAAAAVVALGLWWRSEIPRHSPVAIVPVSVTSLPAPCEQRTLPDGTRVELNRGAEIAVEFSAPLRRVRLLRGEASFTVAKDPLRPFLVVADGIEARALGTVFNVRRNASLVEVLVTEGTVRVQDSSPAVAPSGETPTPGIAAVLTAGQHMALPVDSPVAAPIVTTLSPDEIERRLAWQPRLLDFDAAPLSAIVAAFNERNPVQLRVPDAALAARRMTASFRSDNLEAFVRLLEGNYAIQARQEADGTIVFRQR